MKEVSISSDEEVNLGIAGLLPSRPKNVKYKYNRCALCDKDVEDVGHLNFCADHQSSLQEKISSVYQMIGKSPPQMSHNEEEFHSRLYHQVLPVCDGWLTGLYEAPRGTLLSDNKQFGMGLMTTLKASIMLYKMHLNQGNGGFIQAILDLIAWAIGLAPAAAEVLAKIIIAIVKTLFLSVGICLLLPLELLASDDLYTGIAVTGAGAGAVYWGMVGTGIAEGAVVISGGPVIWVTTGAVLCAVGVSMLYQRFKRGRPALACVNVHIFFKASRWYLQQQF